MRENDPSPERGYRDLTTLQDPSQYLLNVKLYAFYYAHCAKDLLAINEMFNSSHDDE